MIGFQPVATAFNGIHLKLGKFQNMRAFALCTEVIMVQIIVLPFSKCIHDVNSAIPLQALQYGPIADCP
jgi:hypothetical protein